MLTLEGTGQSMFKNINTLQEFLIAFEIKTKDINLFYWVLCSLVPDTALSSISYYTTLPFTHYPQITLTHFCVKCSSNNQAPSHLGVFFFFFCYSLLLDCSHSCPSHGCLYLLWPLLHPCKLFIRMKSYHVKHILTPAYLSSLIPSQSLHRLALPLPWPLYFTKTNPTHLWILSLDITS